MESFSLDSELRLEKILQASVGEEKFTPGLERIAPYFRDYGLKCKKDNIQIVSIAGTNGKGESAIRLYHYLKNAHLKVALWSSPHVLSLRERFLGPDGYISYLLLEEYLKTSIKGPFSFYEALFDSFFKWALNHYKLDVIILEVGLGGRLDAVNLFEANLTAMTSISYDHTEYLGNSLGEILREKFGITRKMRPLVAGLEDTDLVFDLKELCREKEVPLILAEKKNWKDLNFSAKNDWLAKTLAELLLKKEIKKSLNLQNNTLLKGRFEEMVRADCRFIFVGAHNVHGIYEMLRYLRVGKEGMPQKFDQLWLSFSKRNENEIFAIINNFCENRDLYKTIKITYFDHAKALDRKKCLRAFQYMAKSLGQLSFEENWKNKLPYCKGDTLVTGSYYFIGKVQRLLLSLDARFIHL